MSFLNRSKHLVESYSSALFLLILVVVFTLTTNKHCFISAGNVGNILSDISINLLIAVGMTFVIISAGIDLSVGSILAFTAVLVTSLLKHGLAIPIGSQSLVILPVLEPGVMLFIAIPIGLLAAAALGAFNGVMINKFSLPPFIATLAMMSIARGVAFLMCDAQPVSNLPAEYGVFGLGKVIDPVLHVPALIGLAGAIFGWVLLARTSFGRYTYAIGGNEQAARLSGIDIPKVKLKIYLMSGLLAGVAGIIMSSQLGSGDPKLGQMYELNAIAAVALGGTSFLGGIGTIQGTVLGALIIGVLNNGLTLIGVDEFYQWLVKGAVILLAVIVDQMKLKAGSH